MNATTQHILISALIALLIGVLAEFLLDISGGVVFIVVLILLVLAGLLGGNGFRINRT